MKSTIAERLAENLSRVKNLVKIYEDHLAGSGGGRRGYAKTDVLRAATVLLHASLEDFVRSLNNWRLPAAESSVLSKIPWEERRTKLDLGDLAKHRGETVDHVIAESVRTYLDRSNYNSTDDLSTTLVNLGVDPASVNSSYPDLQAMMMRRHLVVHRADQDDTGGSGNHKIRSLGPKTVNKWIKAVEKFTAMVLDKL